MLQTTKTKVIKKPVNFLIFQHKYCVNKASRRSISCNYQVNTILRRVDKMDEQKWSNETKRCEKERRWKYNTRMVYNKMKKNDGLEWNVVERYDDTVVKMLIVSREIAKKKKENMVFLEDMFSAIFQIKKGFLVNTEKVCKIRLNIFFRLLNLLKHNEIEGMEQDFSGKISKNEKEEKVEDMSVYADGSTEKNTQDNTGINDKKIHFSKYCKLALNKAVTISINENRQTINCTDILQAICEVYLELPGIIISWPMEKMHEYLSNWKKKERNKRNNINEYKKNMKDAKNMGNTKNMEDKKNMEDTKNMKDTKNIKDTKNMKETKNMKDTKNIKDTKNMEDTKNMKDTKNIKDTNNMEDTKNMEDKKNMKDTAEIISDTVDSVYNINSDKTINTQTSESSDEEYKEKQDDREDNSDWNGIYNNSKRSELSLRFDDSFAYRKYDGPIIYGGNMNEIKDIHHSKNSNKDLLINMNRMVENKDDSNFFGRKKELKKLIYILGRKKKSNPLLIGKCGVGKTALVEHLAYMIVKRRVPQHLKGFTIYQLNMNDAVSGTIYRGMFEENLKKILNSISKDKKNILFIDEIHTLRGAGAGGGESALDASNIMKPFLSSDGFQCIGATTWEEYRKYIEPDGALKRRFSNVALNELSSKDTYLLLKKIQKSYESYHNVLYTENAINTIVTMSEEYFPNMQNPDKSIDLLDEAGAYQKIKFENFIKKEKQMKNMTNNEINENNNYKNNIQNSSDRNTLQLKPLCQRIRCFCNSDHSPDNVYNSENISDTPVKQKNNMNMDENNNTENEKLQEIYDILNMKYVTSDVIETIVSERSSVKYLKRNMKYEQKILQLKEKLNKNIIGQEKAMEIISQYFLKAVTRISDSERPLGTALFCGSTGVGKTFCAKILSDFLFKKNNLIVINMSEYTESQSVSKLYGSPPGYIGYNDSSYLTEAVNREPFSIVLFDEIEKAHPHVLLVLLRILDEGLLNDSRGRSISFKNTFIIMTSNIGSDIISDYFKVYNNDFHNLGFCYYKREKIENLDSNSKKKQNVEKEKTKLEQKVYSNQWYDDLQPEIEEELKKHFLPEFLNRIDEKVVFRQFLKADIIKILTNMICLLKKRLKKRKNLNLIIYKSVTKYLHEQIPNSYDMAYGARSIKRAIQVHIENPISSFLINKCYEPNDSIVLKLSPAKKIVVEMQKGPSVQE